MFLVHCFPGLFIKFLFLKHFTEDSGSMLGQNRAVNIAPFISSRGRQIGNGICTKIYCFHGGW